ncbi:hypothetical protein SCUP515_03504 [Seiridium cupressi]
MATATSTSTPTRTRRNLGPLTTTFIAPSYCNNAIAFAGCSTCSYGWLAQTCSDNAAIAGDDSSCWPTVTDNPPSITGGPAFHGWGFYSPGIMCPDGYTSACASTAGQDDGFNFQFRLTSSETAAGCCPTGYDCAVLSSSDQTCVSVASSTSVLTGTCPGGGSTVTYAYKSLPSAYNNSIMDSLTLLAPLFQLVHQASDITTTASSAGPSNTPNPDADTGTHSATGAITLSSASPSNTQGPESSTGTHLSTGATAGIGVGVAAAVILIAILSYLLWRSRRKSKVHYVGSSGPGTPMTQYPQTLGGTDDSSTRVYPELSHGSGGDPQYGQQYSRETQYGSQQQYGNQPQELSDAPKLPAELSASYTSLARYSPPAEVIHGDKDNQKVLRLSGTANV